MKHKGRADTAHSSQVGPDSTIPVSLKAILMGTFSIHGCGASSGTMCYLKKKVVGLRWRILFYLIWRSRFLKLLVPSPFCHFEFWQGIDKCLALVNLVFQKPYPHVSVIIFLPVPGLRTEPVRSLRAPVDLNCPDWPHLRPPRPAHSAHGPRSPIKARVWGFSCWPDALGGPCSWLTPCCADGPCYLPPTFSPVGLHPTVRAGLCGGCPQLPSCPVPPPGPGSPSPEHVCRLLLIYISNPVLLKEVLSSTFIQLWACPFHKQNAGRMVAAVLLWQGGQICLFLAAILPFVLSICSLTPLLPLGQLEGCNGQGFSSWQSRSHCAALCDADCRG